MNKPLVSVLMTAYNREKYIKQAVESVLVQTYNNWELIILDDCSKDKTYTIAKNLATKDSRIKVFKNEQNLGQFKNRNKVVGYAEGVYLKYLDSDDLLYPFAIEQLVYYMELHPEAGYGLCSIEQDPNQMFPLLLTPQKAYEYHYIKKQKIFYRAPLSSIIRKSAFYEAGGFPHEAVSGDFAMWHNLSLTFSVVLMPLGFVWYRVHNEQEMQKTRDNTLVQFEYFKVAEYFLKSNKCPLDTENRNKVLQELTTIKKKFIFWKLRTLGFSVGLNLLRYSRRPFQLCPASV